jgi:hypothetical protein
MAKWTINIDNFLGGYAPNWHAETYPSYGNKNMAGAMQNIDLTNAGFLTQGPGLTTLTNGTEAAEMDTLIKGISEEFEPGFAYGIGGNKLYQFSDTAVTNDATWVHTIDKAAVTAELGEDCALYQGNLIYTFGHSGGVGDIGLYQSPNTFTENYGSGVAGGDPGTLEGTSGVVTPYQIAIGNDVAFITNKRYIATLNGSTLARQALDFPSSHICVSNVWNQDRLWVGVNHNYAATATRPKGGIYAWDGTTTSWEREIKVPGEVGGLYVKNATVFFFYRPTGSTTEYRLAYVTGTSYADVATFTGSLPNYAQISEDKDFLVWSSSGLIHAYGVGSPDLPVRHFQYADGGYTTIGGLGNPLGTLVISSNQSTSYKLAKLANYDTSSNWKSLMFDLAGEGPGKLNGLRVNFETLATGARVDWSLKDNNGRTIASDTISFSKNGATNTAFYNLPGLDAICARLEFDFSNGSTTNPVKIKNAKIYGETY